MAGMAEDDGRLWKGFEGGRAVREGHGCISLPVRQTPPLFARSLAAGLIPPSSLPLFSARTEHSLFDFLFPRLSDHHPPQPASQTPAPVRHHAQRQRLCQRTDCRGGEARSDARGRASGGRRCIALACFCRDTTSCREEAHCCCYYSRLDLSQFCGYHL